MRNPLAKPIQFFKDTDKVGVLDLDSACIPVFPKAGCKRQIAFAIKFNSTAPG